jgi:hypothetical protein
MKIGLRVIYASADRKRCLVQVLAAPSTNYANNLVRPPEPYQAVAFTLTDQNGERVELTSEGRKYGAELPAQMRRTTRIRKELRFSPGDSEPAQVCLFDDRCFAIREHGEFTLHVCVTLLKEKPAKRVPTGGTYNGTNIAYATVFDPKADEVTPVRFDPIDIKIYFRSNIEEK